MFQGLHACAARRKKKTDRRSTTNSQEPALSNQRMTFKDWGKIKVMGNEPITVLTPA